MICKIWMRRTAAALLVAATTMVPSWGQGQVVANEIPEDLEAGLFMQKCFNCHQGVLTGRELTNTHQRTRESLDSTVRRMQQYTGPLTEEQINQLVDLMQDEEFVFRVEEAKLLQEEQQEALDAELAERDDVDGYAMLFMRNCAVCHNIGLGNATGIDLVHTLNQDAEQVRANVVRMQQHAGPLTDGQIDGLTALLRDQDRMKRLESAGYENPDGAGSDGPDGSAQETTGVADAAGGTGAVSEGNQQAQGASAMADAHHGSAFPTGLIVGLIIFTVVAAVGCYFFVWRNED